MSRPPSRNEEQAELERVLASGAFAKSQSLARLLKELCTRYFEGRTSDLREYNIGVEALGRPPSFDPTTNSIVRVELHRIREKLKRYYETEGLHNPIVIVLEPGNYAPRFLARADVPVPPQSPVTTSYGAGWEDRQAEADRAGPANHSAAGPGATSDAGLGVSMARAAPPVATAGSRLAAGEASTTPNAEVSPNVPVTAPVEQPSPAEYSRHHKSIARYLAPALVLVLASVALVLAWKWGRLRVSSSSHRPASGVEGARMAPGEASSISGEQIRILAGNFKSDYTDHSGHVWERDHFYSGGRAFSTSTLIIDRTSDAALYQNYRAGEFSYDIPLKPGVYEVRLFFAETTYGPNTLAGGGESSRIFDVEMNGRQILTQFDPLSDAGANNTADERVFTDVTPASDGRLHLRFSKYQGPVPAQDEPIVNALEITPGIRGRMLPILIVAQNNSYTDHAGRVWSADHYACQGRTSIHNHPVAQTSDPGLYYGERYGHFSYAIPVANGKYALTLYFSETYFGPQNPGEGGAGSRIFDVYCNGLRLVHNLDIFQEAGGANRPLEKTFHNLEPNPQGKLLLTFVPVVNYACINAIEVQSED